jgi:3-isopropylmalate dehydrogenase
MKLNLAILPGDGIGPEVVEVALNVVKAVCDKFNHELSYQSAWVGACAIDKFGNPYPDETHDLCMKSDAVLFGAVGDPRFDNDPTSKVRPEQGLLAMRKKLGLFANLRPVETYKSLVGKSPLKEELVDGADFLCIRELTGGLYFGEKGRKDDGNVAYDTLVYSKQEIDRILRLSFQYAMKRRKHLTIVDKANVLESSRLWREQAQAMEKEFPEVHTDYMFVDNAAMQLVRCPKFFDVMVTENMFGDILTDEASVVAGSMGLLASASIGEHTSLFEPIHGSYPQAAGKDIANPLAAVLSAAMMFEYAFNAPEEGALIRKAVAASLEKGIVTEDLAREGEKRYKTSEVGQWLVEYVKEN